MKASPGGAIEALARFGYGARGVVYGLVGGLALLAAFGSGGQAGGSRSALETLLDQPFGRILLGAIALGLAGFATWRLVEAVTDADRRGTSRKALAVRAAHAASGVAYASLALAALAMALGRGGGGGEDQQAREGSAWLLAQPFGQWLLGAVGLTVIGVGLGYGLRAWRGDVEDHLALPPDARRWAVPLGRLGFAARGVVFALVGGFVALAALHARSSEVKGLGGALRALQDQPYGFALLGLTAAGLFAFGLFGLVQARYRRIDAPDIEGVTDAAARGVQALRR
ncbi:MAG TPA: DUF1206 domain-containing protein [Microvirga sp.]|nr:DUF1206 domain-containing protein [Microvirga sp.]